MVYGALSSSLPTRGLSIILFPSSSRSLSSVLLLSLVALSIPLTKAHHLAIFLTFDHTVVFFFGFPLAFPNNLLVIFFIFPHTPLAGGEYGGKSGREVSVSNPKLLRVPEFSA
jgi:Zn-dependent protease